MCTCPLTLSSNKLPFDWRTDKGFFTVPCGKCPDCLAAKKSDWQARSLAEWLRVKSVGGCCYMYTLTYSDENIPILNGVKTFSRRDVQLFLKRLRKALSLKYGTYKLLKYIVTSEYGGNTRRPHYHVLLYFNIAISWSDVRSFVADAWRLGFVAPSSQNHGLVNNAAALLYAMKYITKDMDFGATSVINSYYSTKHFNQFCPFHLQSKGFGSYLSTLLTRENLWTGRVSLPVHNGYREFRIPFYNIRQVLYTTEKNINGNTRYVLNERGISLALAKFDENKRKKREQFEKLLSLPGNMFFLHPIFCELGIYNRADFLSRVGTISDDFLDYVLVYRGLALNGFAYIPGAPKKTLENYLRGIEYPFENISQKFPNYLTQNTSDYENKLLLLSIASSTLRYYSYKKEVASYNTRQRVLYDMQHKKISLLPLQSLEEFIVAPTSIDNLHFNLLDARKNAPETINTKKRTTYARCFDEEPHSALPHSDS